MVLHRSCRFSIVPVLFPSLPSPLDMSRRRARERARIYFVLNVHYYFTCRRTTMIIPRQIITGFQFVPEFRLFLRVSAVLWRRASLPQWEGRVVVNVASVTRSRETWLRRRRIDEITRMFRKWITLDRLIPSITSIPKILLQLWTTFVYLSKDKRFERNQFLSLNFRINLSVFFNGFVSS